MRYLQKEPRSGRLVGPGLALLVAALFLATALCTPAFAAKQAKVAQQVFATPDEAVKALIDACKAGDKQALHSVLGPKSDMILSSGDPVADKAGMERFVKAYEEKHALVPEGDAKVVIEVGAQSWPVPIPVVKNAKGWWFDTRAGLEEVLNRRIGRNELNAIQVCLAYIDVQHDYASKDRTGEGTLQFAQKFVSDEGKKNGLYWLQKPGEEPSPLGPFAAVARGEGYDRGSRPNPIPYHGYYYRILTAQGPHATGGARSYVLKGKMMGGFALVAWPARYGSSGIMSFIVNHEGVVYEKNLGKNTSAVAKTLKAFDPDKSWHKVDAKSLGAEVKTD